MWGILFLKSCIKGRLQWNKCLEYSRLKRQAMFCRDKNIQILISMRKTYYSNSVFFSWSGLGTGRVLPGWESDEWNRFSPFFHYAIFHQPQGRSRVWYGLSCDRIQSEQALFEKCSKILMNYTQHRRSVGGSGTKGIRFPKCYTKPPRVFLIALLAVSFCPCLIHIRVWEL